MSFPSLGLSPALLDAVGALGYSTPTPVQSAAIPAALAGGDVWACARTGSGKTAAYLLPTIERLRKGLSAPRAPRALVLVPTRELATQVGFVVERLSAALPHRLESAIVIGGGSVNRQRLALRGRVDLLIATPGRLLDLLQQRACSVDAVDVLVLDEADRLLSFGFADELAALLEVLPQRRQSLLFSATFPPAVRALVERTLHEPTRIDIDHGALPDTAAITQRAIAVNADRRVALLHHLLRVHGWAQVLVFVASRRSADQVSAQLERAGVSARALHGELTQRARADALADFVHGQVRVLVATDLAARGLDIAGLPAVVNFDLPRSPTDYVHRIGRTGRAGQSGHAVSFVLADADAHLRLIAKRHRVQLPLEIEPGFERTEQPTPNLDPHGGVKGKRKSKKDKLREAAAKVT